MGIKLKITNGYLKFKQGNRFLNTRACIKGAVACILGILNTRSAISVKIIQMNLFLGVISYFLMVLSAMMAINLVKLSENQFPAEYVSKKRIKQLLGLFFVISFVLTIIQVSLYGLTLLIHVVLVLLGILWIILGIISIKKDYSFLFQSIILSLTFSLGLFYGAVLNSRLSLIFIYYLVIAIFFLQLAREITKKMKSSSLEEKMVEKSQVQLPIPFHDFAKTSKFLILVQGVALIFIILPIFTPLLTRFLYLIVIVINSILLIITILITLQQVKRQQFSKKLNSLLKLEIFLQLLAMLLASV
ncbi:MAG: hypothetical protein ACTSU4_06375 [Promethearchaeota archaeon]